MLSSVECSLSRSMNRRRSIAKIYVNIIRRGEMSKEYCIKRRIGGRKRIIKWSRMLILCVEIAILGV